VHIGNAQFQPPLERVDRTAIVQTVLDRLAYQIKKKEAIIMLSASRPADFAH
jgi:hypothetical protein